MMRKGLQGKLIVFWILAIILAGAGILRLYDLEEESLWLDECFTLSYSSKSINLLVEALKKDVHPIGYYLPQHLLVGYFGTGEISLRILSVFFGILSVLLTYVLARKLFSWKEGLLAAFFMAISYTSILYSQEAKMYSMFATFFLLSVICFIRFVEKPSLLNTLFFSFSIALLLYTHIIGFAILLLYTVFYLLCYVVKLKKIEITGSFFQNKTFSLRFFLVLIIVFLLYLPWLKILTFYQIPLLYSFLGSKLIEKVGANLLPFFSVAVVFLTFLCFVFLHLVLIGKIDLTKSFRGINSILSFLSREIILFWLISVFIIVDHILSSYFFSSVSIIRFGFFLLPLLYIILSRVLLRMRKNTLAIALFVLFIVSASLELYMYYSFDSKEQYHEAADYIKTNASPADVLFLHRATIAKLCFDYYYSGNAEEVRLIKAGEDDYLLKERAADKRDAYLILSHNYHTKGYFKQKLDALYEFKEEKKVMGVTVYKYDVSES